MARLRKVYQAAVVCMGLLLGAAAGLLAVLFIDDRDIELGAGPRR